MQLIHYAVYTSENNFPPAQHIIEIDEFPPPLSLKGMREYRLDFLFSTYDVCDECDAHRFRYISLFKNEQYPYNIIDFKELQSLDVRFEDSIRLFVTKIREKGDNILRLYKTAGCCNYLSNNIFMTLNDERPPAGFMWFELLESPLYVQD